MLCFAQPLSSFHHLSIWGKNITDNLLSSVMGSGSLVSLTTFLPYTSEARINRTDVIAFFFLKKSPFMPQSKSRVRTFASLSCKVLFETAYYMEPGNCPFMVSFYGVLQRYFKLTYPYAFFWTCLM